MSKILEIRNIEKTFNAGTINANYVLKNLSLDLEDGDYVTVIGGNGAGKSTMLNAVSGSISVDSGHIIIDGEDVTKLKEYQRASSSCCSPQTSYSSLSMSSGSASSSAAICSRSCSR